MIDSWTVRGDASNFGEPRQALTFKPFRLLAFEMPTRGGKFPLGFEENAGFLADGHRVRTGDRPAKESRPLFNHRQGVLADYHGRLCKRILRISLQFM
jgi:hypothetical protein